MEIIKDERYFIKNGELTNNITAQVTLMQEKIESHVVGTKKR